MVIAALVGSSVSLARADVDDPLYACHVPPAGTKVVASFQPETSLQDLAVWVTGFTCKNVVFAADVAKRATKVTVISPGKMTPKQALALFVDAVSATGLVVQVKPDTIVIKLGPNMPQGCPDIAASSPTKGSGGDLGGSPFTPTPPDPSATALEAKLDKGIRKVDATHYVITGELVDAILANPMETAKGARVVPAVKNGQPDGFKLYAIRAGSLYARIGLENGDQLRTINGLAMDSADKALDLYTKVRDAAKLEIQLLRRGKPMTITIDIKR